MKINKPVIFYYFTGIQHLRQLRLLESELPSFEFVPLLQPEMIKFGNVFRDYEKRCLTVGKNGFFPKSIWAKNPRLIIFRHALPTSWRLQLMWGAIEKKIPTLAWEEVNQLTLNDKAINNYLLPTSKLLVPSRFEKKLFVEAGFRKHLIDVIGWPFVNLVLKRTGRDVADRVATVTVGVFRHHHPASQETVKDTERLFRLIDAGLPEEWIVWIKPHPAELKNSLRFLAKQCFVRHKTKIFDSRIDFNLILDKTDLLINRGLSQTCLEALAVGVKLAVVPFGLTTRFTTLLPESVISSAADLTKIASSNNKKYDRAVKMFLKIHINPVGQKAKKRLIKSVKLEVSKSLVVYTDSMINALIVQTLFKRSDSLIPNFYIRTRGWLSRRQTGKIEIVNFGNLLTKTLNKYWKMEVIALLIRDIYHQRSDYIDWDKIIDQNFDYDLLPFYFEADKQKLLEILLRHGRVITATNLLFKASEGFRLGKLIKLL